MQPPGGGTWANQAVPSYGQPGVNQGQGLNGGAPTGQVGAGRPSGSVGGGAQMNAGDAPPQTGVGGQPSAVAQLDGVSSEGQHKGFGNTPTSSGSSKSAEVRKSLFSNSDTASFQSGVKVMAYTPCDPKQLNSMSKWAADMGQLAVQQYMPTGGRHKLDPDERERIAEGESRWLPRVFQSYGTPAHEMMSSPGKGALLYGLGGAGLGALAGHAIGNGSNQAGLTSASLGAALGAAAGGIGAGTLGYLSRSANNEGIKELMSHSPKGATKRDLLADPVYQRDIGRDDEGRNNIAMMAALSALSRRE